MCFRSERKKMTGKFQINAERDNMNLVILLIQGGFPYKLSVGSGFKGTFVKQIFSYSYHYFLSKLNHYFLCTPQNNNILSTSPLLSLIFSSPSCPGNQATEIDKVKKWLFTEHLQCLHFAQTLGRCQARSQHSQTLTNHITEARPLP